MDPTTIGGGIFAFGLIVLADKADVIVDALSSSDDPLTDFDTDAEAIADETDDSPDSVEDT